MSEVGKKHKKLVDRLVQVYTEIAKTAGTADVAAFNDAIVLAKEVRRQRNYIERLKGELEDIKLNRILEEV